MAPVYSRQKTNGVTTKWPSWSALADATCHFNTHLLIAQPFLCTVRTKMSLAKHRATLIHFKSLIPTALVGAPSYLNEFVNMGARCRQF